VNTRQHGTRYAFAPSTCTHSFTLCLSTAHHPASPCNLAPSNPPAIPFPSPPRVSSPPSTRAPPPHKGAGPDAIVSYVRYRQLPSIDAVGVAKTWSNIVRYCVVTTAIAARSIARRHLIVPSHTTMPMWEVMSTVWPRSRVWIHSAVWGWKANFHSPHWDRQVRILHGTRVHKVPRRHGIVLEQVESVVFRLRLEWFRLLSVA
jgi:hypothetical protein